MGDELHVGDLDASDAPALAALHVDAFPNFFLTSLGEAFLARFYRSLLERPWGLGVGVLGPTGCGGFAVGSIRHPSFYRDLARTDGWPLFVAALPAFVRHPGRLLRIGRSLGQTSYRTEPGDAILCSLCVAPKHQRVGNGRAVLQVFERRANEEGCQNVVLTTDADANERVNRFYQGNGYELVATITNSQRRMNCYRKRIQQRQ